MNTRLTTGTGRSTGTWLGIVAVAALAVGLIAGPVLANVTAPRGYAPPVAGAASDTTPEHTIAVTGLGKVTVVPDMANIQLGVAIQRPTAKAAREAAAAAMTKIVAALKALGIDDKDITTAMVSLGPVYSYPNNASPVVTGYQLANSVSVKVRDLSKLSDVLDNSVAAGATTVDGVSFDVADRSAAEAQARDAAVKDAKAKADTYAKGLGIAITGVASVTENVATPIWYGGMYNAAAGAATDKAAAPQTPVLPGSTDVTITVQVSFLIG
jgi:uncharacterized protein YggE